MRHYKKAKTAEIRKIFCNRCNSYVTIGGEDIYNEGVRVYYEFGYFSPLDGAILDIELCSDCLIELFEKFIQKQKVI